MATPDDEKLDELKRLLRRLDKALPPAHGEPSGLQGSRVESSRQAHRGAALRTIALAGSVSMIVSLGVVALLLYGTTPLRHVLAVLSPSPIEIRSSALEKDAPPEEERQPAPVTETAALRPADETTADHPSQDKTSTASGPSATTGQRISAPSPIGSVPDVETPSPASPAPESTATPEPAEQTQTGEDTPSTGAPHPPPALVELDASQFLRRGLNMLSSGNIEAGQLLLERAADLGSGDAAFALASTYDGDPGAPRHDLAVRPNARLAVRWYERARALGIEAAQKRLDELKAGPGSQARKAE
jgi:hypothetical protein